MTTPAHIQELTDAIKANHPSVTFHDAYDIATLAFSMSAEICAEWHDNQECEAMKAHDAAKACGMGFTSTALRDAERHKKYAAAIRALAVEG